MSLRLELLGPRHDFEGGLFLTDYKSVTAKRPIESLPVQETLHVPLTVRADLPTEPAVKVGQRVLRGEKLAHAASLDSLPVYAPTSGAIVEFGRAWTPLDGFLPCVMLRPDAEDQWLPLPTIWEEGSFIQDVVDGGVLCPSPRLPLHELIHQAAAAGATELVINAMETEPYLTADLRALVEEPGRLIDASCEIADAVGAMNVRFALPFRHRRVVKRIEAEARGRHIEIVPLSHKYPQCDPIVLTKTLLDLEVPPGGTPLDVGVLVLPLAAVRMAAQALLDGRPVTHALMTVAGDAVERPGTYKVAVGTPIRDLARRVGLHASPRQVIWGGPLPRIALTRDDAVVTSDAFALLLFQDEPIPEPVPCIRCGWCVEDCPVGLDPVGLMHLEAEVDCDANSLTLLRACIDCGLCTHVCPSQLPLAQSINRARRRFEGL